MSNEIRKTAGRFLELLGAMKRYVREEIPPLPDRGMSEEKFRSLLGLRFLGRSPLKTLAAHDGLSASAQCIMLNRLVDEGYAERTGDAQDRRSTFYALTRPGLDLLKAEIARRTGIVAARMDGLSKAERERFARGIESVFAGLQRLRAAPEGGTGRE